MVKKKFHPLRTAEPYLYLIPAIAVLCVFLFYPMVESFRLSFTLESPDEAVRIFRQFAAAYLHNAEAEKLPSMTRGHYRRGAM